MKAIIVYGSTTGNTQNVAGKIYDFLCTKNIDATIEDANGFSPDSLNNYDLIMLGSSTWGDGELQDDMQELINNCNNLKLKDKKIATFGCGDEMWPQFCAAVDILNKFLTNLGAISLIDGLKINGDVDDNIANIDAWNEELAKKIC